MRPLTEHSSVTVAHGVVSEVIILHVVGLVLEGSGPRLSLQQKVGGRGTLHDVLLKRTGITHHLTVIHAKISCKDTQLVVRTYGEAMGVGQEAIDEPQWIVNPQIHQPKTFADLNWTSKTCLVIRD